MDELLTVDSIRTVLLLVALFLIGYPILSWIIRRSPKNLPPGPREWGTNWKIMKASWNGTLPLLATEWAKKYGDVTCVYSCGQPLVFLNSAEVSRQLIGSDKYKFLVADRAEIYATSITKFHGKDLIFSKYDAIMRKKRRLFYNALHLYGDGVEKFENVVWAEMQRMFADIDGSTNQDVEFTQIVIRSLKIILYILAFGERPAHPNIPDILEEYDLAFNSLSRADVDFVMENFPFVARLPGKFRNAVTRVKNAKKVADDLLYYTPKKNYIPGQPRGIIDLLLDYQNKPGNEWMANDEEHILAFLASLFLAAQLTSRASLIGTFLCLLNNPKITERIQKEVDTVIGDGRPKIEHKASMPYTEATILEALRIISQLPLSGFRKASEDIDFRGMLIPKNSLIFMNNWFFLHDERVWENPWDFKPERFLDKDGHLLPADHPIRKDLIAFGIGVRACPGEVFGRSRVFLFLTSILQRYNILPPANEKLMPADFQVHDDSIQGIVQQTPGFRCRLIRRKQAHN